MCVEHAKKAFCCTLITYASLALLIMVGIAPAFAFSGGGAAPVTPVVSDCPAEGFRWVEEEYFVDEEYYVDDDGSL